MTKKPFAPPRLGAWLLYHCIDPHIRYAVMGDFEELYAEIWRTRGAGVAQRWYWGQVLRSLPTLLFDTTYWSLEMLKNYLKIGLRTLHKHRAYTFINVTGLAVGMACSLLIFLYVQDELSYDRHHDNADRIYRLIHESNSGGQVSHIAVSGAPLAPLLSASFPELAAYVRLRHWGRSLVTYEERRFYEERLFFADASLFEVFTFRLIEGQPETALEAPSSIILTERMARKYFDAERPVGKTLTVDGRSYTITGIAADPPESSHFHFDFLASFSTLEQLIGAAALQHPGNQQYHTYFLLAPGTTPRSVEQKIPDLIERMAGPEIRRTKTFALQPLPSIHLHSQLEGEIEANGSIANVYIFSAVALFILLIACINFMNLATARSAERAREVGVRKVMGAHRGQLAWQFLGESVLLSVVAAGAALLLVGLSLPSFNALAGKTLAFSSLGQPTYVLALLSGVLVVGILAGSYPALVLSRFRPALVLKGGLPSSSRGSALRQGLVIAQFAISIVLLVGTLVVSNQLSFMLNKTLGFEKEQVVVVPVRSDAVRDQLETVRGVWTQMPGVVNVTASSGVPGRNLWSVYYFPERRDTEEGRPVQTLIVDPAFLPTLGIEVVEGRGLSADIATDETDAFLVNEEAVRQFGWTGEALGKKIVWPSSLIPGEGRIVKEGRVVGVVKDFHFASLHQPIEPLFLHIMPDSYSYLSARIAPQDLSATLQQLEDSWRQFDATYPFEYFFLDANFDALYRAETRFRTLFGYAALLAIFIACLGLFGLVSFTAERRTKEIGVRKVLGASVPSIVLLLSKDLTKLVGVASLVAVPVAYLAMTRWLEGFAYRVDVSVGVFLLAGVLALLVAWVTVAYQSVKAARINPVDALRYE